MTAFRRLLRHYIARRPHQPKHAMQSDGIAYRVTAPGWDALTPEETR